MVMQIELSPELEKRMKAWSIEFNEPAEKLAVGLLNEYFDDSDKGKGLTGSRTGQWRYRIGDYRVICEVQGKIFIVLVLEIGHRSDVYKK